MRLIFYLLMLLGIQCSNKQHRAKKVLLYAMEEVSPTSLHYLQQGLHNAFGFEVIVASDTLTLAAEAWYAPHKRYWADSLLVQIKKKSPPQKDFFTVGITGKDISTSLYGEPNRGVMGLSYQGGCCAIISDYRLHQMGRSRDSIDFYLLKVALHEMGHCLGLAHCKTADCLMEDAAVMHHIASIHNFCITCKKEIHRR